jgi:uncharacterized cupin superfamily protein
MIRLLANHCVAATSLALEYGDIPAVRVVAGTPRVGSAELGAIGDGSIGVWEHSPGTSTDVEADEFFIVLSGAGSVTFDDGTPPLALKAGTVGQFAAGTATTWTVTETLRKVYVLL